MQPDWSGSVSPFGRVGFSGWFRPGLSHFQPGRAVSGAELLALLSPRKNVAYSCSFAYMNLCKKTQDTQIEGGLR